MTVSRPDLLAAGLAGFSLLTSSNPYFEARSKTQWFARNTSSVAF